MVTKALKPKKRGTSIGWEYLWASFKHAPTSDDLDEHGSDGWELVSVLCIGDYNTFHCFFKREKHWR